MAAVGAMSPTSRRGAPWRFTGWAALPNRRLPTLRASPMPPSMSFSRKGSFVLTYATSHHALKRRREAAAGETSADSGVSRWCGTSAIQLAKITGATGDRSGTSDDKLALS